MKKNIWSTFETKKRNHEIQNLEITSTPFSTYHLDLFMFPPTNYRGHIQKHMEPYKIGEVTKADMAVITSNTYYDDSAYENNPPPYPDLLVNTRYFKYHSYALAYMARLPKLS